MRVVCLEDKTDNGTTLRVLKGGVYDVLSDFVRENPETGKKEEFYHLAHAGNDIGVFRKERFRVIER